MDTLLLTADEAAAFQALPAALREGWNVIPEQLTSFESAMAIQMRLHSSQLKKYPYFQKLADAVTKGKVVDPGDIAASVPEEVLPQIYFALGARGLTFFIRSVLRNAAIDEHLTCIAAWSAIRHDILETNASVTK